MNRKVIITKTIIFLLSAILLTIIFYFFVSDRELKEALFIGVGTSILSTFLIPAKNTNNIKWKKLYVAVIVLVIALLIFFQLWQKGNINLQMLLLIGIIGILLIIPYIIFNYRKNKNED